MAMVRTRAKAMIRTRAKAMIRDIELWQGLRGLGLGPRL